MVSTQTSLTCPRTDNLLPQSLLYNIITAKLAEAFEITSVHARLADYTDSFTSIKREPDSGARYQFTNSFPEKPHLDLIIPTCHRVHTDQGCFSPDTYLPGKRKRLSSSTAPMSPSSTLRDTMSPSSALRDTMSPSSAVQETIGIRMHPSTHSCPNCSIQYRTAGDLHAHVQRCTTMSLTKTLTSTCKELSFEARVWEGTTSKPFKDDVPVGGSLESYNISGKEPSNIPGKEPSNIPSIEPSNIPGRKPSAGLYNREEKKKIIHAKRRFSPSENASTGVDSNDVDNNGKNDNKISKVKKDPLKKELSILDKTKLKAKNSKSYVTPKKNTTISSGGPTWKSTRTKRQPSHAIFKDEGSLENAKKKTVGQRKKTFDSEKEKEKKIDEDHKPKPDRKKSVKRPKSEKQKAAALASNTLQSNLSSNPGSIPSGATSNRPIVKTYMNNRGNTSLNYRKKNYNIQFFCKRNRQSCWVCVIESCYGKIIVESPPESAGLTEDDPGYYTMIKRRGHHISTCRPRPTSKV